MIPLPERLKIEANGGTYWIGCQSVPKQHHQGIGRIYKKKKKKKKKKEDFL